MVSQNCSGVSQNLFLLQCRINLRFSNLLKPNLKKTVVMTVL